MEELVVLVAEVALAQVVRDQARVIQVETANG